MSRDAHIHIISKDSGVKGQQFQGQQSLNDNNNICEQILQVKLRCMNSGYDSKDVWRTVNSCHTNYNII